MSESLFNKVKDPELATLLQKDFDRRFPVKFEKKKKKEHIAGAVT